MPQFKITHVDPLSQEELCSYTVDDRSPLDAFYHCVRYDGRLSGFNDIIEVRAFDTETNAWKKININFNRRSY